MRFDGRVRGWVEEVTGSPVARTRRMHGGASSAVHDIVLADGRRVVLRRTFDTSGLDLAAQRTAAEVHALGHLPASPLTPRLLGADLDGEHCGRPAVLMSRLPGRPWVAPGPHVDAWLDGMAEALRFVRDLDDPGIAWPRTEPWLDATEDPPPWTDDPDAWSWAFATVRDGLPPGSPDRLLHRDLHPGNALFHRRRLSGVIDWEAMCRGPAELDVARCRVQVAILAGSEAADALLARCADLAPAYAPAWDALVACELSPWTTVMLTYRHLGAAVTLDSIRRALDTLVTQARAAST